MMEYNIFKNVIKANIIEALPPVYDLFEPSIVEIPKQNGKREAFIMHLHTKTHGITTPNIYLDELYEEYKKYESKGKTMNSLVEEVVCVILAHTKSYSFDSTDSFVEKMKDGIIRVLVNKEMNEDLLYDVPHKDFIDLAIMYRFIKEDGNGFISSIITNDYLKEFNLTLEELDALAEANGKRLCVPDIIRIADRMQIITNTNRMYGATTILRKEEVKKVADEFDSDVFLLPSSVHEFLAIKPGTMPLYEMKLLLNNGNSNVIQNDEILSHNIYLYSREKDMIMVV